MKEDRSFKKGKDQETFDSEDDESEEEKEQAMQRSLRVRLASDLSGSFRHQPMLRRSSTRNDGQHNSRNLLGPRDSTKNDLKISAYLNQVRQSTRGKEINASESQDQSNRFEARQAPKED